MKQTLLRIVQDMLAAIDSEDVQDIGETEESGQCVQIANRMFEELIQHRRWRHIRRYDRLSTTAAKNEMVPPNGTIAFDPAEVYYDGVNVVYLTPNEFRRLTIVRDEDDSNVTVINDIKVYTDRNPNYFTSDDDYTLIFDSVPNLTSGLNASKTNILAWVAPTEPLTTSTAVFSLPHQLFPVLKKMCIGTAKAELKGDTAGGNTDLSLAMKMLTRLTRNARLVDDVPLVNSYVRPRPSSRARSQLIIR